MLLMILFLLSVFNKNIFIVFVKLLNKNSIFVYVNKIWTKTVDSSLLSVDLKIKS